MTGKKPSTPKADFAALCATTPARVFAGRTTLDASCATPEPEDYKGTIKIIAGRYLTALPAYEQDVQRPSREMLEAAKKLKADYTAFEQGLAPEGQQYLRDNPFMVLATKADRINTYVNNKLTYATDLQNNGKPDHWQSPSETLKAGKGDCEDYAMLKMALLEQAGFPREKMWIAVGVLMASAARGKELDGHATLVVELAGKPYVLDNFYKADNGPYGGVVPLQEFYDKTKFAPVIFANQGEVMGATHETLKADFASVMPEQSVQPIAPPIAPQIAPLRRLENLKPNTP